MQLVLLSGGSGKRLWPLSNNARSKQFLPLLEKEDGRIEIDNPDWWNEEPNADDKEKNIVLGDNEYFMMGDNRNHSSDSRVWGPVTRKAILAKAWLRYYKGY